MNVISKKQIALILNKSYRWVDTITSRSEFEKHRAFGSNSNFYNTEKFRYELKQIVSRKMMKYYKN